MSVPGFEPGLQRRQSTVLLVHYAIQAPCIHRSSLSVVQETCLSLVVRKPAFCICENKDADQLRGNRYSDSVIPLLYKSEISTSSYFLKLHRPVCVRPSRKPRRPVFSQRGSRITEQVMKYGQEGMGRLICPPGGP